MSKKLKVSPWPGHASIEVSESGQVVLKHWDFKGKLSSDQYAQARLCLEWISQAIDRMETSSEPIGMMGLTIK